MTRRASNKGQELKGRIEEGAGRATGKQSLVARGKSFLGAYEHIKDGLVARGDSEDLAEERAARTVNKARARSGEAKQASRLSIDDIASGRRGGLRSHRGRGGRTREQLYEEARRRNVTGRSKMTKAQLEEAVDRRGGS